MKTMRFTLFLVLAATAAGAQDPAKATTGEVWQITQPPQSSLVFARDGSMIGEIGRQARTSITIGSLPRYVPQAFVAIEDQRFYEHNGVDYKGLAGVLKDMVTEQKLRGGSTITQQLVGIMHPDIIDRRDRSPSRKLHEQSAAREMEKHYTKQEILEAFLNQVDLGHNWFGVEMAARHYFGISAAQLSLAQAASLAALPKSPPLYDPIRNPVQNRARRNVVLDAMAEQKLIPPEAAARAKAEPVVTSPNNGVAAPANYFVDAVRTEAEKSGIPIINGGYRIYTTLDIPMQQAAVNALLAGTAAIENRPDYKHLTQAKAFADKKGETDYLQGAAIVMDPYTGDVRALVGGRNYQMAPFNRATIANRQPGSSIKPIVFAKALEEGIPINRVFNDTLLEIPLENGQVYMPANIDNKFLGPMTLREALIKSRNNVAIQLGLEAGMDSVAALSKRLGITSRMLPVPASAIGASVVHPIELTAAYTAFVNNGQVVEPRMITRIADLHGRTVYETKPSVPRQVIDPRVAFIMRDVMRDVADRGSGVQARRAVPSRVPVAGKTGTTNDNVDVWFFGLTPDFVGSIWLGFDKPSTITSIAQGGTFAAPIWGQMMGTYYANRRAGEWPTAPAGLVFADVDRETGELATPMTSGERRQLEYFVAGTEPLEIRSPWNLPRWGPVLSTCVNAGIGCW
jgi:penicillin-binding protein 2D